MIAQFTKRRLPYKCQGLQGLWWHVAWERQWINADSLKPSKPKNLSVWIPSFISRPALLFFKSKAAGSCPRWCFSSYPICRLRLRELGCPISSTNPQNTVPTASGLCEQTDLWVRGHTRVVGAQPGWVQGRQRRRHRARVWWESVLEGGSGYKFKSPPCTFCTSWFQTEAEKTASRESPYCPR